MLFSSMNVLKPVVNAEGSNSFVLECSVLKKNCVLFKISSL